MNSHRELFPSGEPVEVESEDDDYDPFEGLSYLDKAKVEY
jgi:hypothetical protein